MTQLLDQAAIDELLQIVVKGSRAQFVLPVRLPLDFLHDSVPVQLLPCQRQQDVKGCGRERQERTDIVFHIRISLYRIPSYMSSSKGQENRFAWRTGFTPVCLHAASGRRNVDPNESNRTRGNECC